MYFKYMQYVEYRIYLKIYDTEKSFPKEMLGKLTKVGNITLLLPAHKLDFRSLFSILILLPSSIPNFYSFLTLSLKLTPAFFPAIKMCKMTSP